MKENNTYKNIFWFYVQMNHLIVVNKVQSQQNFSHKYIQRGWQDKIWYPEMEIDRLVDLQLFKIERRPASKLSRYHFMQV